MFLLSHNVVLLALILHSGLQQGKPSWIDHPEKNYPSTQYLTALGSGDSRKEAENSAASNLSKIFESRIKSEETINARYMEIMKSPNQSSLESQTGVDKRISVSSEQTLMNVRYPESYTDNLGRVFVLAVLDREPTAVIYKNRIDENYDRMKAYEKRFKEIADPLQRYAAIDAALVIGKANETLKQQLAIVMPGTELQQDSTCSVDKIAEICSESKKAIPFAVSITGSDADKVTSAISETLSQLGFPISAEGVLTVGGKETIEQIDLNRPEKFVRWSYEISVCDTSGTAIISLSQNGREGHITYEEAIARALRTMRERIRTDFAKQLNRYFDQLEMK